MEDQEKAEQGITEVRKLNCDLIHLRMTFNTLIALNELNSPGVISNTLPWIS